MDESKFLELQSEIIDREMMSKALLFVKKALLEGKNREEEIRGSLGLTKGELDRLKEFLGVEDFSKSSIIYRIDAKNVELESQINELKSQMFQGFKIYIFYNWRKGIKARWPGLYRSKNIRAISRNIIIFLSSKEVEWYDIAERKCRTLIGSGLYFTEFVPEDVNETVMYQKELHGIHLTQKILDELLTSPPRIKGRFEDMHREFISVIPLSKVIKDRSMRNYLKSVLVTTLLKDRNIFKYFLQIIRNHAKDGVKKDELVMLSSLPEFYNKLLIPSALYNRITDMGEEMLSVPGLAGYEPKLDTLTDFLKEESLEEIVKIIGLSAKLVTRNAWEFLYALIS
ncbi:MAG: hypothetical protein ACP6IP_01280 [Candidatus Njordarchaeia archaeon]